MRTFHSAILLLLVLSLSATSLYAQTEDGSVPAEEGICDDLKGEGFPKALYGLCVAYCEAEARSEAVLTAYDRIRNRTDPPAGPAMPCDEPDECPCWGADRITDRLILSGPITETNPVGICGVVGGIENAFYLVGGFELFEVNTSVPTCSYNDFEATVLDSIPINSPGQVELCRTDIDMLCGRLPVQ